MASGAGPADELRRAIATGGQPLVLTVSALLRLLELGERPPQAAEQATTLLGAAGIELDRPLEEADYDDKVTLRGGRLPSPRSSGQAEQGSVPSNVTPVRPAAVAEEGPPADAPPQAKHGASHEDVARWLLAKETELDVERRARAEAEQARSLAETRAETAERVTQERIDEVRREADARIEEAQAGAGEMRSAADVQVQRARTDAEAKAKRSVGLARAEAHNAAIEAEQAIAAAREDATEKVEVAESQLAGLQERIAALEDQLTEARNEIESRAVKLSASAEETMTARAEAQEIRAQLTELESRLSERAQALEKSEDVSSEQATRLERLELTLNEERAQAAAQVEAATRRADLAEEQQAELEQRLAAEGEEGVRTVFELEQTRTKLESSYTTIDSLEHELEKARKAVRSRSKRLIEEARAHQEETQRRLDEEVQTRVEVERVLAQREQEAEKLSLALATSQAQFEERDQEAEKLRLALATSQAELEERSGELAEADGRAAAVGNELVVLRASSEREISELRDALASNRAEFERRLAAADERAKGFERTVAALRATIDETENRARAESDAANAAWEEMQRTLRTIEVFEEQRQQSVTESERAARRVSDARRALAALERSKPGGQAAAGAAAEAAATTGRSEPTSNPPAEIEPERTPNPLLSVRQAAESLRHRRAGRLPRGESPPQPEGEPPNSRHHAGLFGRWRARAFRDEPGCCAVCQRELQVDDEAELKASGWIVSGDSGVCPPCQEDGWQLPEGAAIPFRRTPGRERS